MGAERSGEDGMGWDGMDGMGFACLPVCWVVRGEVEVGVEVLIAR